MISDRDRNSADPEPRGSWPASSATPAESGGSASRTIRALTFAPRNTASLNQLAELAARLLHAPSAHVALVDDVQTVLGGVGASTAAIGAPSSADDSLCSVPTRTNEPLMVSDAGSDARVNHLAPVASGAVGSYLGVPLRVRGEVVGALCVYGPDRRPWGPKDLVLLEKLSGPVTTELDLALVTAEREDERLVWQLAVDAAEVGAFDWNLVTGELRWDDRLLDIFGLSAKTFGGTIDAFNDAVHVDDRARVAAALDAAIATCGLYSAEYRIIRPDGTQRWVSARGRALAGTEDTATRLIGAAFDTTAEQDGEARVARVLEAMPSAFIHLDQDWRFTYINNRAERLLASDADRDLIGRELWEAFPSSAGSPFETHFRHAMATGEPVEFEAHSSTLRGRWHEVRAWPSPDGLAVYLIDITERREAQAQAAAATERNAVLVGLSDALVGTLDITEAAARLARDVVGLWADWSVVTLVDHAVALPDSRLADPAAAWRRGLDDVAGWHVDAAQRPVVERYCSARIPALTDSSFLAAALRQDRPVVIATDATAAISRVFAAGEARDLLGRLAPESGVVVPLRGRDRTVGLLSVFRGPDRPPFTPEDVADLVDAAGRAGLALDNLRLYADQRDLAEGLQRSLMTAPPQPDDLQIAVRYEPSAQTAQVGGDWYDAFAQPDGSLSVVIGDVVGHDTAAAAAMSQIRTLLRGIAVTTEDGADEVLRRVDGAMRTLQVETTATAIVARLVSDPIHPDQDGEPRRTRLRWSNAGHPPPMLAWPAGPGEPANIEVLWPQAAELLLGLDPATTRTQDLRDLPCGATLLLYTDGLVERRGQPLDVGIDRLATELGRLIGAGDDLDAVCDALVRRMLPERPEDDVALVAVRLAPPA